MRKLHAHEQVVKVARDMAFALYEEAMSGDNELYANWKNNWPDDAPEVRQRKFVELVYPKLLEPARAILAHMLGNPRYAHLHESIYDSIVKDNAVRAGRVAPSGRPLLQLDSEGAVTKVTRR